MNYQLTFVFLVLLAVSFAQPVVDIHKIGNNKEIGKYVETRGFRMYYEVYGVGEPLLLIHGNGGSLSGFFEQIPYFSKKYRVIAVDSRAQGKSADPSDSLSYEMMADDFNALLDTLKTGPCNVIGWSDGGIIGLMLAMRNPEKVKKLAITGANLWPDSTAIDPFIWRWALGLNDDLANAAPTPKNLNERKLVRLLSYEPHITTQELGTIQCPTLVIGGDHDVILPQHTMLIAQSIPKSYLWILPNSGHSTPIVYKDMFNQVVDTFLSEPYRVIEGMSKLN